MLRIRLLEDAVHRLFLNNEVEGTTHLYQGQEAVAVGVCDMLEPGDTVAATYRGHGAALALGVDQTALLGRAPRTRDRHQRRPRRLDERHRPRARADRLLRHRRRLDRGRHRSGARVAAHSATARWRSRSSATAPSNQAYFHECLNFAGVRALPVVYVCENNLYGEWTPMFARHRRAAASRPGRPPTASPRVEVDGNDVLAVREAAAEAVARARDRARGPRSSRRRPTATRATRASTRASTGPKEEVDEWLSRDPLPRLAERLGRSDVERIRTTSEAELEIDQALEARAAARTPTPDRRRQRVQGRRPDARGQLPRGDPRRPRRGDGARRRASSLIGEDVEPGGVFNATPDLVDRFGHDRVIDTPISELAFTSAAFGAAVKGLRPVVEIMFGDFLGLVVDTLVNQASKYWYLSNEQACVPLVVRSAVGAGARFGACHSQTPTGWFLGEPGLKLVARVEPRRREGPDQGGDPGRQPGDRLRAQAALRAQGRGAGRRRRARPDRQGGGARARARDVTIVAALAMVDAALAAAEELAGEGIEAEVIDLRTLRPLDADDDRRLGREDRRASSSSRRARRRAATRGRRRARGRAGRPDPGAKRVTMPDLPIPFSAPLEDWARPSAAKVVAAARSLVA